MMKRHANEMLKFAPAALAAEQIFSFAGFPITNSMINAWIAVVFFVGVAFVVSRRKGALVPRGIHNVFEAALVWYLEQMDGVTSDRKKSRAFLPLVGTIFFFLLFSNWIGLMPGTGTIGVWGMATSVATDVVGHGGVELLPLLRPVGADLNMTLALAVLSLVYVQFTGIRIQGFINYFSKFVNIRGIFRAIPKGPMAFITAVIEFFVGIIEIASEFAKVASLSLRLFGNVFAGEVLIGVMLGLVSFLVPIPFMFLEILVGFIQATVFSTLVLVFLVIATESHDDHGHEESHDGGAKAHASH
ncbi:MAG: F0F1 ATP synthase subunit A [Patescibacteria group bacterium]|mgnify:FL=1